MRSAFAILLSLLLIATQTAYIAQGNAPSRTDQSVVHKCCRAGAACHASCCVGKDDSAPISTPIAPYRTLSQTDSQWLTAPIALAMQPTPVSPSSKISSDVFLPSVTALPLYERNCSYLL